MVHDRSPVLRAAALTQEKLIALGSYYHYHHYFYIIYIIIIIILKRKTLKAADFGNARPSLFSVPLESRWAWDGFGRISLDWKSSFHFSSS